MILKQYINNFVVKTNTATNRFFILAICSAIVYDYQPIISIIIAIIAILLSFRFKVALLLIILYFVAELILSSLYIVIDKVELYNSDIRLRTPTINIIVDKETAANISIGTIIYDKLILDEKSKNYYRKQYFISDNFTKFKVPIISSIINYRYNKSEDLFYISGGKITLAQALILGDKRFIPPDIRDKYIITGLAHLLAISGMHVGIIVTITLLLLSFLPIKLRFMPTIIMLLFMMVFAGFSITVIRSVLFVIFFMIAYIFDYIVDSKRFIIFLASIFIIFSPNTITDISFLLSFSATFGIIYLLDNKGKISFVPSLFMVGIAATILTSPLSLYFFNTTNHLSIISTIIMLPIIYLEIILSIITLIATDITLPALVAVEAFSIYILDKIYSLTFFAFTLKSIPLEIFLLAMIFAIIMLLTKYKYLAVLSLLIIFYPAESKHNYIFPKFYGSTKGFISFHDNRSEIFFSGSVSQFKYILLPIIAKYGETEFDYGRIRIFSGNNLYLKIKNEGIDFQTLSLNNTNNKNNNSYNIFYYTRSNTINSKNHIADNNSLYIIYKNKFQAENILPIAELGGINITNRTITYNNDDNK